jgi:molybdate transport system regulatory protein
MIQKTNFTTKGKIWLEMNNVKVLGPGRVELLEHIHALGSIRQAALQMDMSYRQAWDLIKQINSHFTIPVVTSQRGGKGGGNATVSSDGLKLIKQFHALQAKFELFLKQNIVSTEHLQSDRE